MKKVEIAEQLSEMLQTYAYEVEEGEHDTWTDDYIVDSLCDMKEVLHNEDVGEGRRYESFLLIADHSVKVYQTITVERAMSGDKINLKVMSIENVTPKKDGKVEIEFLAKKI